MRWKKKLKVNFFVFLYNFKNKVIDFLHNILYTLGVLEKNARLAQSVERTAVNR